MPIYINNTKAESTLSEQLADSKATGTYYLTDNPEYYEIQRNNNFVFYVSGLKEKLKEFYSNNPLNKPKMNKFTEVYSDDVLKVSVASSSVPHFKQNAIQIRRGNGVMKFAGVPEFDSHTIKLDDFIGAGTSDVINAWQSLSYNVMTEKVGLAADYKMNAYLLEYTPDYQLVRTIRMMGCWVSGISEDDFDHNSNDKHSITATIEFDKAWVDTSDVE